MRWRALTPSRSSPVTTERLHPWGSRLVLLCHASGSVSKSVTKEPQCRRRRRIDVGIMRFLLACSALFQAFVTNLDTIGRLVGEDGGPLGSFSSAGSTCARSVPGQLAGCEQRSLTRISLLCGLQLKANSAVRGRPAAASRQPSSGGEPGPRLGRAAEEDSTEGWDAPASHPSVSAQSRIEPAHRVFSSSCDAPAESGSRP